MPATSDAQAPNISARSNGSLSAGSPRPSRAMAVALAALALGAGLSAPVATAQAPRLLSPVSASDGGLSFADLVERVSPAVVSILVEREVERPQVPDELEEFFRFRFGQPGDDGLDGEAQRLEAQGSGFFIDQSGHIVTNNHVIEGSKEIKVRLADGKELAATLVGADPLTDLAVLKVDAPKGQAFVQFADDVNLRVGDWVVAVGNPFGLSGTVTSGIVSAIGREGGQFTDFIQIDAPINRGNSGGPTFDLKGRVVGVNTAIFSTNGGSVGIGFAIPARTAKETVAQLISNGSVTRGWLGVSIQELTTEIAAALDLKEAKGALVNEVLAGTPAAAAGLESGDLVTKLNGKPISNPRDLTRSVSALPPGERVKVTVLRKGAEKTLTVTLGQRTEEATIAAAPTAPAEDDLAVSVGLRVANVDAATREQFRLPPETNGVVITGVRGGSPAANAGLRAGMVILQVDQQPVANVAALKSRVDEAVTAKKEAVLLQLQVGGVKQFGALSLARPS